MSYRFDFTGGVKNYPSNCLFVQTSTATVANTTTETALTDGGVGTLTVPANFFIVGRTLRIWGQGFHSTTGTPTLRIRVKLGSTVIADTGAQSSTAASNNWVIVNADITCRTTGVSGTVFCQGEYREAATSPGSVNLFALSNTTTSTIDTTISQAVSITAEWGTASASNTISMTNLTLEVLY